MMPDVLEGFVARYEDRSNGFGVGSDHHVRSGQVNTRSLTRGTKVAITTRDRLRPWHDFDTGQKRTYELSECYRMPSPSQAIKQFCLADDR